MAVKSMERKDFTKVLVRFIGGKHNKIGFVAEYYTDIAKILVDRGHVEVIKDAAVAAVAKEEIKAKKAEAVNKKSEKNEEAM